MTDRTPILVVGEAVADILRGPDGADRAYPGGSPANVAVGLARLGRPVRLASRLGDDDSGRMLLGHLRGSGVTLADGCLVAEPTSTATAVLDADGRAAYRFDITWDLPSDVVATARRGGVRHVHTGSIAAVLPPGASRVRELVDAVRPGATVSYDPNVRPDLLGPSAAERPRIEELVALSDVVKASDEDLAWLYPGEPVREVAARWAAAGPRLVVVTLGAHGCLARWPGGEAQLPASPVAIADTVGAGDAFMAGLISGLTAADLLGGTASGGPPQARARLTAATGGSGVHSDILAALSFAGRVAAITCGRPGADPPLLSELVG